MKTITFTLLLTLTFFFNVHSQDEKKTLHTLWVTFDCATNDGTVQVADIKNCKKLICVGTDSQYCKIISGLVSVTLSNGLKECRYKGDSASQELITALNNLATGDLSKYDKIYIENVIVEITKEGKSPIRKKLPTSQVIVKN